MAPDRVAERAIEQGGEYVAAHEFPDPLGQPKVALETGRQRPRLPVNVIQISITLVDEAQRNVGLDDQPTAAANDGVRKAPAPHPTCFVRWDVRQEALCIGDSAIRQQTPTRTHRDPIQQGEHAFAMSHALCAGFTIRGCAFQEFSQGHR